LLPSPYGIRKDARYPHLGSMLDAYKINFSDRISCGQMDPTAVIWYQQPKKYWHINFRYKHIPRISRPSTRRLLTCSSTQAKRGPWAKP